MVRNGDTLVQAKPVHLLIQEKTRLHGVSHGLAEAGYDIRLAQDVTLHGFKRFSLASSMEHFRMPLDLVGVLHDKSTLIRQRLMVGNTVAEPGWEGYLTLELFYFGWKPLRLKKGQGIGQMIFHVLENTAAYQGKYQYQENRPVPAILDSPYTRFPPK